jgi:hypothetical protein
VSVLGESGGKVDGYGALAYSAFSAYHGDLVFNLVHSVPEKLTLFRCVFSDDVGWVCAF